MERLLYIVAKGLVSLLQALPLRAVARLGRAAGGLAYWLDGRHRRVAQANVARCFPDKADPEVRALVRENFRRLGENFACGIKTVCMSADELRPHLSVHLGDAVRTPPTEGSRHGLVAAIGHFGNFELFAHVGQFCPGFQVATTYRALNLESINRLLQSLREQSGCLYFERRFDNARLREAMNQPRMMLGLLSDQDGGDRGLQLPFLGHNCSTSPAPAVFALRYDCPLYTAICYREGLARWRIEAGPEIPTRENGAARSTTAIMRDVNVALEQAVRRDPANWFWVHNRWKRGRPDAAPWTSDPRNTNE